MRQATIADAAALVLLINRAYRVEDFFINGDRTHEADIRERLSRTGASFLVVDAEGNAGLAAAVYVEMRGTRGYFGMLSVDPDQQRRGLGRRLIAATEEACRGAGCRFLDIDVVNLREELPAFYAAQGFTTVGTAPFPDPAKLRREAHLVLMTKPLPRL